MACRHTEDPLVGLYVQCIKRQKAVKAKGLQNYMISGVTQTPTSTRTAPRGQCWYSSRFWTETGDRLYCGFYSSGEFLKGVGTSNSGYISYLLSTTHHKIRRYWVSLYTPQNKYRTSPTTKAMYVQRNTDARSWNHSCGGKAKRVTYSECVFVAFVIQNSKRTRRITPSSVACLVLQYFSTLPHKREDFRKKGAGGGGYWIQNFL